jgi:hypothetical protein
VPEGAKAIRVPKTVDCLQGLINVVPLQLLSYREFLACPLSPLEQSKSGYTLFVLGYTDDVTVR